MYYVILISHDHIPTLFGPYCSFNSALAIAEGPCCNVPRNALMAPDETYFIPNHDTFRSVTITTADKIGYKPEGM